MKAPPMVGDSLLAGLLACFDLLIFIAQSATDNPTEQPPPWYVTFPLILAVVAPLVVRRSYPVIAAYATWLFSIPPPALELGVASLFSTCIALYTLVAYVGRKPAV